MSACSWLLAPPFGVPTLGAAEWQAGTGPGPGPLGAEGLCGGGEEPIGETEVSEQERDSKEAIGGHMDFR